MLETKSNFPSKFKASAHIIFTISLAEANCMAKSHWLTLNVAKRLLFSRKEGVKN